MQLQETFKQKTIDYVRAEHDTRMCVMTRDITKFKECTEIEKAAWFAMDDAPTAYMASIGSAN